MPVPIYTTTCISKSLIARGVYEFRFSKPEGFSFLPGQYVLFNVPLIDNPQDVQIRALSLASLPSEGELVFVAKIVPGGRASRWIEELLSPGVTATFLGPFGRFLLNTTTDKDFLFIATGTGLAPFRPMILQALTPPPPRLAGLGEGEGESSDRSHRWREE